MDLTLITAALAAVGVPAPAVLIGTAVVTTTGFAISHIVPQLPVPAVKTSIYGRIFGVLDFIAGNYGNSVSLASVETSITAVSPTLANTVTIAANDAAPAVAVAQSVAAVVAAPTVEAVAQTAAIASQAVAQIAATVKDAPPAVTTIASEVATGAALISALSK